MCNGLVEKCNGTLKSMLKRMTHERPGDWDRYIPALLFAYREVPQESLKFELLYGRTVRGPMSILRELWTGEVTNDETRTTYQYVMELRERMKETCRLAHEESKKAKVTQKEYYNRKARDKCLSVGDKVLLLLPTDNNKLHIQWKGPYDIIQKVAVNDYRIQIGENTKTFHANMLRKYVSREKSEDKRMNDDVVQGLQLVSEDQDSQLGSEDTMFCPLEATESWTDISVCRQLTAVQQEETRRVLEECGDVFSDLPGHTDIAECTIELVGDTPIRCKNYPVPLAMEQVMKEEVIKMDRRGITEPSTSDYASPSVIVRLLKNSIPFFFSNIGLKLAREMESTSNVTYTNFLTNPCMNTLSLLPINEETTITIIDDIKAKNSESVDGLSVKLLKAIKYETSKAITHMINQSLHTGIFPDKLKLAKVIPVFKKADRTKLDNYRPISILPAISQIFERAIFDQLYIHFTHNNLFYESQYGFLKKKNTRPN